MLVTILSILNIAGKDLEYFKHCSEGFGVFSILLVRIWNISNTADKDLEYFKYC